MGFMAKFLNRGAIYFDGHYDVRRGGAVGVVRAGDENFILSTMRYGKVLHINLDKCNVVLTMMNEFYVNADVRMNEYLWEVVWKSFTKTKHFEKQKSFFFLFEIF